MRKLFAKIHLWLALPFGIVIGLICLSGAILSFENEITQSLNKDRYYVKEKGESPLPMDVLVRSFMDQTKDSVQFTGIQVTNNPAKAYQFTTAKKGVSYLVDQYSGEILGMQNGKEPFFLFTFRLHRWFLDSMKAADGGNSFGKNLVGVSTIIMALLLISGLVIWFPKNRKMLKYRLKFNVNKSTFACLHSWHVSGGFYTALILLALSLTGLTWSFGWYCNAFYKVFGASVTMPDKGNASNKDRGERGKGERSQKEGTFGETSLDMIEWQTALETIKQAAPNYKTITLSPSGEANVSTSSYGNSRASDKYKFDTRNGRIKTVELYKDQPKSSKIRGWIYSVHTGSWGGMTTRIITCLSALFGTFLVISGYYFWIRKKIRKQ